MPDRDLQSQRQDNSQGETVAARAVRHFVSRFGEDPVALFQAPGRVNLIGEHTDYNDGFVLPMAIDMGTVIAVRPAARGCFRAVAGDVPLGAGLSSSASLTVAFGIALAGIEGSPLNPLEVPHLARRAENDYVGCACGIMDQLISAQALAGNALLIDCRDLTSRAVPIPADLELLVFDSRVQRELAGSEYNLRRQQCQRVAEFFGVAALRDVSLDHLMNARKNLAEVDFRRAKHVVTENIRTLEAAVALAQADVHRLSQLMAQSHLSLRDDFEITVPAVDALVEIVAQVASNRAGVRMTGGGFGGCVVALVERQLSENILAAVATEYPARTGLTARVHRCRPAAGAGPVVGA